MLSYQYQQAIKTELAQRYPRFQLPLPHRLLWLLPLLGWVTLWSLGIVLCNWHWAAQLSVAALIGISYASLGFLGHDILHGSVVRGRRLQNLLGGLCMSPFGITPVLWRWQHNDQHHHLTQIQGQDPDGMPMLPDYYARPAVRFITWLAVGRPIIMLGLFGFWFQFHNLVLSIESLRQRPKQRLALVFQGSLLLGLWLLLFCYGGPWLWLLIHGLPSYVGGLIVMSFIGTNHLLNELAEPTQPDPVRTSLSLRMSWLAEVIFFNFNHHTAHHIYRGVSSKYYPVISQLLQRNFPEVYHELPYWQAVWLLAKSPKVYLDQFQLVDPLRNRVEPVLGHTPAAPSS